MVGIFKKTEDVRGIPFEGTLGTSVGLLVATSHHDVAFVALIAICEMNSSSYDNIPTCSHFTCSIDHLL